MSDEIEDDDDDLPTAPIPEALLKAADFAPDEDPADPSTWHKEP